MSKMNAITKTAEAKPKGHYMGIGIAIGMGIGIPISLLFGVLMDKLTLGISIGPAIGAAIGVVVGAYLEKKRNPNPIEDTSGKQKYAGLLLALVGALVLLIISIIYFILKHQ